MLWLCRQLLPAAGFAALACALIPESAYAQFTFTQPSIAALAQGSAVTIKWTGGSPTERINLTLVKVAPFKVVAQVANGIPNSGTASWRLPAGNPDIPCGDEYEFYIENVPRTAWQYGSKFKIACAFALTQPAAGANLSPGTAVTIQWNGGNPSQPVSLSLVQISPFKVAAAVASSVTNSGQTGWTIPANDPNVPCGAQYQFYIEDSPRTVWQYGPKFNLACAQTQQACTAGQTMCAGTCVQVASDAQNCGTCGHQCGANYSCSSGVCQENPSGSQQSGAGNLPAPAGLTFARDPNQCAPHISGGGGMGAAMGCAATIMEGGHLVLIWKWTGAQDVDGFRVYQVTDSQPHQIGNADRLIDTVDQYPRRTGDVVAAPAEGYVGKCYAVTAFKGKVESMTNRAFCINTPLPPGALRRTTDAKECAEHGVSFTHDQSKCRAEIQGGALVLVWNWDPAVPVDGFKLYKVDQGQVVELEGLHVGANDTGMIIELSYHYQGKCYAVSAFVKSAESPRTGLLCVR